jgi:hypothetical protein
VAQIVDDDNPEGPVVAILLVLVAAAMTAVAGWYSTRQPRPAVVAGGGGATPEPHVDHQQLRAEPRSRAAGVATCPQCGEPTRPGAVFCAVCKQLLP